MSTVSSQNETFKVEAKWRVIVINQSDHHPHITVPADEATASQGGGSLEIGYCQRDNIQLLEDRDAYDVATDERAYNTFARFKKQLRKIRKKGWLPVLFITETRESVLRGAEHFALVSDDQ